MSYYVKSLGVFAACALVAAVTCGNDWRTSFAFLLGTAACSISDLISSEKRK